eukprot:217792-Hanusia_phi.AAC.2
MQKRDSVGAVVWSFDLLDRRVVGGSRRYEVRGSTTLINGKTSQLDTSGVAGTRSVALFLMYWLLFSLSLHIGRQQGQSNLRPSVVVYLISSVNTTTCSLTCDSTSQIVFLSTMLGSAFSTFGVEDCSNLLTRRLLPVVRVEKDAERKVLVASEHGSKSYLTTSQTLGPVSSLLRSANCCICSMSTLNLSHSP